MPLNVDQKKNSLVTCKFTSRSVLKPDYKIRVLNINTIITPQRCTGM